MRFDATAKGKPVYPRFGQARAAQVVERATRVNAGKPVTLISGKRVGALRGYPYPNGCGYPSLSEAQS